MSQLFAWMMTTSKKEELEKVGELSDACSQIVLKCFYLARIGGPDILWSVNKVARADTLWTRVCHRRSARLISNIHRTSAYRQYCHCRLSLFQDSDFAGVLEDSKSTPRGILCLFPLVGCARSKSQCLTVPQNRKLSLDAGLRMDGIIALDLWDVVIDVLHSSNNVPPTQKKTTPKSKPK